MSGSRPGRARIRRPSLPRGQRGIALLVAILLVALGTMLAAAVGYDSVMAQRRGVANVGYEQAVLVAQGAEALAAYALREVQQQAAKSGTPSITTQQAWAQPVGPVEIFPDVMLEAQLEDLGGRFNLNWLVDRNSDQPNIAAVQALQRLLARLDIEPKWAGYLVDWIDHNTSPLPNDGAEDSIYLGQDPAYRTANLYVTSTSELLALPGFGAERYAKLAPYVAALPPDSKFNICTAHAAVLDAFLPNGRSEFGSEEDLAKARQGAPGCWPTLHDYQVLGPVMDASAAAAPGTNTGAQRGTRNPTQRPAPNGLQPATPNGGGGGASVAIAQTSSYFRLTTHVTLGSAEFNLYSLLWQDSLGTGLVRPMQRTTLPD